MDDFNVDLINFITEMYVTDIENISYFWESKVLSFLT